MPEVQGLSRVRGPSPEAFWGTLGSKQRQGWANSFQKAEGYSQKEGTSPEHLSLSVTGTRGHRQQVPEGPTMWPEQDPTRVDRGTRQREIQRCQQVCRAKGRPGGHGRA